MVISALTLASIHRRVSGHPANPRRVQLEPVAGVPVRQVLTQRHRVIVQVLVDVDDARSVRTPELDRPRHPHDVRLVDVGHEFPVKRSYRKIS